MATINATSKVKRRAGKSVGKSAGKSVGSSADCARALGAARPPRRGASRRTARHVLGPELVVTAALRIADAHGADAVSMRALAAELGVEAMSLYSHVPSKEVLLGLMAARLVESMPMPSRTLQPRRRLRQLADGMRSTAHAHPNVFPLVVLMPLKMRAAVRPTEVALAAFLDAGLGDARAIRCQRVFLSFVRGYLLWEIGGLTVGRWSARNASLAPASMAELASIDAAEFPETLRLATTFARISPDQAFEEGLDSLMAALLPEAPKKSRSKR